jgi:hypothetical protein
MSCFSCRPSTCAFTGAMIEEELKTADTAYELICKDPGASGAAKERALHSAIDWGAEESDYIQNHPRHVVSFAVRVDERGLD